MVAGYCIFAGLSEVWVGITGNWMGLLSKPLKPSFWTALVGTFYVAAGISLLPKEEPVRYWASPSSCLRFLGAFTWSGSACYPSRGPDFVKSVVGGAIAILVVVYLATQWRKFDAGQSLNSPE